MADIVAGDTTALLRAFADTFQPGGEPGAAAGAFDAADVSSPGKQAAGLALRGAPMAGASIDDGVASVRAMVAIAESARTGKPVRLADAEAAATAARRVAGWRRSSTTVSRRECASVSPWFSSTYRISSES